MAQLAASLLSRLLSRLLGRLLSRLEKHTARSAALVRMDVTQHGKPTGTQAWCRPDGGGMENGGFLLIAGMKPGKVLGSHLLIPLTPQASVQPSVSSWRHAADLSENVAGAE
jgi:hypothetical protein